MALFVFGAGATRGCEFVKESPTPCLPPLDRDFFTQLQRVANPKHQDLIKEVMRDVVDLFGLNFDVSLENVFTTLEHTIKIIEVTGGAGKLKDFKKTELVAKRKRLMQAIVVVFEESLSEQRQEGGSKWTPRPCEYHRNFVENVLKSEDALVSFNYDCVLDYALKEFGGGIWNPRYGYHFYLGSQGNKLKGDEYWNPEEVANKSATVRYFKLHGSLHFDIKDPDDEQSEVTLKQLPYTKTHGYKKFTIIPPEWHKAYNKGVFARQWAYAASEIYKAKHIVFIGYSMPLTDLHSTALFRTSVKRNSLESLVVVNPDKETRKRTRTVVQRGLSKDTRVMSFDYFHEFLSCKEYVWRNVES